MNPIVHLDDHAVATAVEACFARLYREGFADEAFVNHGLPIEVRAFRRTEGWCVFLLLTPWMLARLFIAEHPPGLPVPDGWDARRRHGAAYVVIGPALEFKLLGASQRAHLNHDPALGHYLVQPLVQSLDKFDSATAVFEAWNEVIATRVRVMEEQKRECGWQREVSRREFFVRLSGKN